MTKLTSMRVERIEAGLTLAGLGRLVGLDETGLSRVERGQRTLDAEQADRVAAVLGVSADHLFTEQGGRFVVTPMRLAATA